MPVSSTSSVSSPVGVAQKEAERVGRQPHMPVQHSMPENNRKARARSLETPTQSPRLALSVASSSANILTPHPHAEASVSDSISPTTRIPHGNPNRVGAAAKPPQSTIDTQVAKAAAIPPRADLAKRSSVGSAVRSGVSPIPPEVSTAAPPKRPVIKKSMGGGGAAGRNTRISMQEPARLRSDLFAEANAALVKQNSRFSCPGPSACRESTGGDTSRSGVPDPCREGSPWQELDVGARALSTIDRVVAQQICSTTALLELEALELPDNIITRPEGLEPLHLGTWMVYMVHRVALDDPSLTQLNFSSFCMPTAEEEPLIAEKLMTSIAGNTHLVDVKLADCNVQGGRQAQLLADALVANKKLRVLDIALNFLQPADLQRVFAALAQNPALEELRCSNQFCEQQIGRDAYAALAETFKTNQTLRKVGMQLLDAHWRDQINRGIVRNVEAARIRRFESFGRSSMKLFQTQIGGA